MYFLGCISKEPKYNLYQTGDEQRTDAMMRLFISFGNYLHREKWKNLKSQTRETLALCAHSLSSNSAGEPEPQDVRNVDKKDCSIVVF